MVHAQTLGNLKELHLLTVASGDYELKLGGRTLKSG